MKLISKEEEKVEEELEKEKKNEKIESKPKDTFGSVVPNFLNNFTKNSEISVISPNMSFLNFSPNFHLKTPESLNSPKNQIQFFDNSPILNFSPFNNFSPLTNEKKRQFHELSGIFLDSPLNQETTTTTTNSQQQSMKFKKQKI